MILFSFLGPKILAYKYKLLGSSAQLPVDFIKSLCFFRKLKSHCIYIFYYFFQSFLDLDLFKIGAVI